MEHTHAASEFEHPMRVPTMSPLFPYRNESGTALSTSMATRKSATERGGSSSAQDQPANAKELRQGIRSLLLPEVSEAEYQLESMKVHDRAHIPRYVPQLESLEILEEDAVTSDKSPTGIISFRSTDAMMPSSPESTPTHTPGSSDCSNQPSNLVHDDITNSIDVDSSSNGELSLIDAIGSKTNIAPAPPNPNEPSSLMEYDSSSDSDDFQNDDEIEANDECAECRAAGNVSMFEAVVIRTVGHDLALAASLVPILHLMAHQEHAFTIDSREIAITQCASGPAGTAAHTSALGRVESSSNGGGTKRSADNPGSDRDAEKQDDEDEEENEEHNSKRTKRGTAGVEHPERLICPFHKWKPEKYSINYHAEKRGNPKFRACHGPGFNGISRLKDHLKNVHRHVQCGRCKQIFEGKVEQRIRELEEHRRQQPCQSHDDASQEEEGISDVQWNEIENMRKRFKDRRPRTDVEIWNEIWAILFPRAEKPDTPWYERSKTGDAKPSSSSLEEAVYQFSQCYQTNSQTPDNYASSLVHTSLETSAFFRQMAVDAFKIWYVKNSMSSSSLAPSSNFGSISSAAGAPQENTLENLPYMAPDANGLDRTLFQPSSINQSPNRSVPPTLETRYNQSGGSMRPCIVGHHGGRARSPTTSLSTLLPGSSTPTGYGQQDSQISAVPSMPPYSIPYHSSYNIQDSTLSSRPSMPLTDSFYGHGHHGPSNVNPLAQRSEQQVDLQMFCSNRSSENGEYSFGSFFPSQLTDATSTSSYQQCPNTFPTGTFLHTQASDSVVNSGLQTNYTNHHPQAVHGHRNSRCDTIPDEDSTNASYRGNWASETRPHQ